jgi:hypothetical protein
MKDGYWNATIAQKPTCICQSETATSNPVTCVLTASQFTAAETGNLGSLDCQVTGFDQLDAVKGAPSGRSEVHF